MARAPGAGSADAAPPVNFAKAFHCEIYFRIAFWLDAQQVARTGWTSSEIRKLLLGCEESDPDCRLLWRSLCRRRWENKPRFSIGESRYEGQLFLERRPSQLGLAVSAAAAAVEGSGRDEIMSELSTPLAAMPEGTPALLGITAATRWREAYVKAEVDARRRFIRRAELVGLAWLFNFSSSAGGGRASSMQEVSFRDASAGAEPDANTSSGQLLMEHGYPPLEYKLETKLKCARCNSGPCTSSCSRCKLVMYCSRECQRGHWKEHSGRCDPSQIVTDVATVPNPAQRLQISNFPPHIVSRVTRTWEWRIHNSNVSLLSARPNSRGKFDVESAVARRLLYIGPGEHGEEGGGDVSESEGSDVP